MMSKLDQATEGTGGHTSIAYTAVAHPDGKTLASGGDDGGMFETEQSYVTGGAHASVLSVAFSQMAKTLASEHYDDGTVSLWDVQRNTPTSTGGGNTVNFPRRLLPGWQYFGIRRFG